MNEINDYLSKADEEIAKNIMYRVYGMPGPLFVENEITPTPKPDPKPSLNIPFYVENITQEDETLTIAGCDWTGQGNYLEFPVEYSTDGTVWSSFGTTGETPLTKALQPGEKVYLRATTDSWYQYLEGTEESDGMDHGCSIFGISKVGGNIMSLLYGSNFTGNETAFPSGSADNLSCLFNDIDDGEYNRNLVSVSELILPATTLTERCYSNMFYGCTSLATTPELPATILAENCYNSMFAYCTSLTTAPTLPATILAVGCYMQLFEGCSSLTTAPTLPAITLADGCYGNMFNGCTSLTTAPELPATTLASNCYSSMFNDCTSLTTAPELPATTLAESCYSNMFHGCTSLMVAPELPATTLTKGCYRNMFSNCTTLTTAPELPATTLAIECYNIMFEKCTKLNYIKCLAIDISADGCLGGWVKDVSSTGTFVKNSSMATEDWPTGAYGIPSGWTVENAQ